jgi:PAS domain S-box-containing protein
MPESALTVLVVDDEPHVLDLLKSYLEQAGMSVLSTPSAEQALALPQLDRAHVALLDIRLPGKLNGHELLRILNDRHPDMAKILMSGQAELDDAISGYAEQAFSFIKKPFGSLHEIRLLIERAAESKRLVQANRLYADQLKVERASLEEKAAERAMEMRRYQRILAHLFAVTSRFGSVESADNLLDFVCQAIVEAGAFRQAVILLADEQFRIRHAGAWQAGTDAGTLRESLRGLFGQPLRPHEFHRTEEHLGKAVYVRQVGSGSLQEALGWGSGDQLFLPVLRHDGTVFGYLSVDGPTDGARPNDDIVQLLEVLLDHSTLHIEAQRMRQDLERRAEELEQRVQERTSELRLSQEKFSRLVNSTTDIVYIVDENDRLVYLNEAFTHTLGYVRENYVGRPLVKLFEELATDNPMNRRAIQELGTTDRDHSIHHVELVARSGDKRTLEINRTIMRQAGAYRGSQGIVRDVTEHRALLQQLVATERLATTGRLAAGVAHEINNPLQAVSSHLNAAQQKIKSNEDPAENLGQAREGIERIRQIVRSMLDLHRTPAGPRVPVNLNEIVEKVVSLVIQDARDASIDLRLDLAADLAALQGSPQELQQVILNLVLNAMEAMPNGGELVISTRNGDATLELRVHDSGSGISPEHLSQIFEPFFTYKPSGTGTGLGLYLSKNIVEMHHGKITVTSDKDKGTTFVLAFPTR